MAIPEADSAVGHSFGLEIDGIVIKHIQQVEGLRMEQDEIELRQNTADGKFVVKKLPGRPKSGQVTLTRGLTGENSFDVWIKDARFGRMKTRARARRSSSTTTRAHRSSAIGSPTCGQDA